MCNNNDTTTTTTTNNNNNTNTTNNNTTNNNNNNTAHTNNTTNNTNNNIVVIIIIIIIVTIITIIIITTIININNQVRDEHVGQKAGCRAGRIDFVASARGEKREKEQLTSLRACSEGQPELICFGLVQSSFVPL